MGKDGVSGHGEPESASASRSLARGQEINSGRQPPLRMNANEASEARNEVLHRRTRAQTGPRELRAPRYCVNVQRTCLQYPKLRDEVQIAGKHVRLSCKEV